MEGIGAELANENIENILNIFEAKGNKSNILKKKVSL